MDGRASGGVCLDVQVSALTPDSQIVAGLFDIVKTANLGSQRFCRIAALSGDLAVSRASPWTMRDREIFGNSLRPGTRT